MRRRIIDTTVRAACLQDRVQAVWVERRADPEVHRRAQECLAHAVAFRREVIAAATLVDEANSPVLAAVVIEFRDDDFPIGNEFAVLPDLFPLHVVFIATADVEHEVDVPGEYAGDIHDQLVGEACIRAAFE